MNKLKLVQIKQKKQAEAKKRSEAYIETVDRLEKSVSELKNTFEGLDFSEVIEALSQINSLKQPLEAVNKSLVEFKLDIPEIPGEVTLKDADKLASSLKSLKIPDKINNHINLKPIEAVTKQLQTLNKAIDKKLVKQGQTPEDFVPVRRVRKIGNQLLFDDDAHRGGGSGGASVQDSLISNGRVKVTVQDGVEITNDAGNPIPVSGTVTTSSATPLATRIDEASSTITYIGEATAGSATSGALWRIKRMDTGTSPQTIITWADGNTNFDNIYDNRAGLSYS